MKDFRALLQVDTRSLSRTRPELAAARAQRDAEEARAVGRKIRDVTKEHAEGLLQFGKFSDTGQDEVDEEEEAEIAGLERRVEELEAKLEDLKRIRDDMPVPLRSLVDAIVAGRDEQSGSEDGAEKSGKSATAGVLLAPRQMMQHIHGNMV